MSIKDLRDCVATSYARKSGDDFYKSYNELFKLLINMDENEIYNIAFILYGRKGFKFLHECFNLIASVAAENYGLKVNNNQAIYRFKDKMCLGIGEYIMKHSNFYSSDLVHMSTNIGVDVLFDPDYDIYYRSCYISYNTYDDDGEEVRVADLELRLVQSKYSKVDLPTDYGTLEYNFWEIDDLSADNGNYIDMVRDKKSAIFLQRLFVNPDFRNKGVGSIILNSIPLISDTITPGVDYDAIIGCVNSDDGTDNLCWHLLLHNGYKKEYEFFVKYLDNQ